MAPNDTQHRSLTPGKMMPRGPPGPAPDSPAAPAGLFPAEKSRNGKGEVSAVVKKAVAYDLRSIENHAIPKRR